jgi:hypothetical protein
MAEAVSAIVHNAGAQSARDANIIDANLIPDFHHADDS